MKSKVMVFIVGMGLFISSCNKDKAHSLPEEQANTSQKMIAYSVRPGNPRNPFDSIGVIHNIVLDSIRNYVKKTGDTTWNGRSRFLSNYWLKHYGKSIRIVHNPDLEFRMCTQFETFLYPSFLSSQGKSNMEDMVRTLKAMDETTTYAGFKNDIVKIEDQILTERISDYEKNYLFTFSTVLRHSGFYWMGAFENGSVSQVCMPMGFLRKILGVIAGIGADASGAAYYYFTGDYGNLIGGSITLSECCGYYTGWY